MNNALITTGAAGAVASAVLILINSILNRCHVAPLTGDEMAAATTLVAFGGHWMTLRFPRVFALSAAAPSPAAPAAPTI
jgi:hypothetical protein